MSKTGLSCVMLKAKQSDQIGALMDEDIRMAVMNQNAELDGIRLMEIG